MNALSQNLVYKHGKLVLCRSLYKQSSLLSSQWLRVLFRKYSDFYLYYSIILHINIYVSLLGLILIDELLAAVYNTKPGFMSIIITRLYLDNPLLDYFSNLFFPFICF